MLSLFLPSRLLRCGNEDTGWFHRLGGQRPGTCLRGYMAIFIHISVAMSLWTRAICTVRQGHLQANSANCEGTLGHSQRCQRERWFSVSSDGETDDCGFVKSNNCSKLSNKIKIRDWCSV
jgi:hypothetical protein